MIIHNPKLVRCQYIRLPYYENNTLFTIQTSKATDMADTATPTILTKIPGPMHAKDIF